MSAPSKDVAQQVVPRNERKQNTYAYHAHDFQEVLAITNTHESGLLLPEVRRRQEKNGTNTFTPEKKKTVFHTVLKQLMSPLAFVLVIAFFVTVALQEYIDATVIFIALAVAVGVGVLQEGRSSRAFERLASSQVHKATVIRNGGKQEVLASDLVVGDIVMLQSGAQVPADTRIIQAKKLSINEAPLTGEWIAVKKKVEPVEIGTPFAEQSSMAWMGTFVAEGYAHAVVVAVGDDTAVGKLAKNVRDVHEVPTPLQDEMVRVSRIMLYIISALVLIIFGLGIYQGQPIDEMLLMAIAIAVASVPEGLPAAVTIILAIGMETLLKRGGLVRNLLAAETLGSTTYVLTDKTGTLTQAKMKITGMILDASFLSFGQKKVQETMRFILDVALGASDAYTDTNSSKHVVHGDPVEQSILQTAKELDISESKGSMRAARMDYLSFTSENRFAAALTQYQEKNILCCNGAPSILLSHASHFLTTDGRKKEMTKIEHENFVNAISIQTQQGKRLVAVGYKYVSYKEVPEEVEDILEEIIFAGVLVFDDPIREGVSKAIEGVQQAGAQIMLITGDNPQTALSIAQTAGIAEEGEVVLVGNDLEKLSDEELYIALNDIHVFARILPSQKMRIVSILQQKGEVVAMTGDGINDAPALRRANIGIAIGSGTEVAKEASDLVLVNDSFETIYAAIEEGRRIIANLRKIVGYLLSTSLSEVVLIGTALLLGSPAPILPAQILWANVIEEGFMSVAFAFEKGDKNAMRRKPKDIHEEGILSKDMFWFIAMVVTIHGLLLVSLYLYVRFLQLPLEELRSVMFLAVAVDSLFISFAFRSLTTPVWKIPLLSNLFFVGSLVVNLVLLSVVLSIPFFQSILSYSPLPMQDIAMVVGFSLSTLFVVEIAKWLFFEREDSE